MDLVTLALFISAVVVLSITPGPDFFLIVGRGVSQGRKAAVFTALGFFLAGFVQVPLLAFGLATVVAENPFLFDILRYAGGAYLIWRGIRAWLSAGSNNLHSTGPTSVRGVIREGFIASLANPKSHVFLLAFLPQFVHPERGSVMYQFVVLGLVMRITALMVESGIAIFAGTVGQRLKKSEHLPIWLERIAGSLLVAVGLRLVLMDRPFDTVAKH